MAIEAKVRNMHRIDLNTEHFQCRRQVVGEDKIDFRRERRVHRTKHSQEPEGDKSSSETNRRDEIMRTKRRCCCEEK